MFDSHRGQNNSFSPIAVERCVHPVFRAPTVEISLATRPLGSNYL